MSEAEKAAFGHVNIDEPKTPFVTGTDRAGSDSDTSCRGSPRVSFSLQRRRGSIDSAEEGSVTDTSFEKFDSEDWDDDEDDHATDTQSSLQEHQRFLEHRAQHYHMKQAIAEARDLMQNQQEQEESE